MTILPVRPYSTRVAGFFAGSLLSGMVSIAYLVALSTIMLSGISITWHRVSSKIYPYSMSQPSSYRHVVLRDASNRPADYFFPSLGSFVTNVNVYAYRGWRAPDEEQYLSSLGGQRIHHDGSIMVARHRYAIISAHFRGIADHWTMEQTTFVANGFVWRLTASYEDRFHHLRSILLRMLRSFSLRPTARHHHGGRA